MAGASGTGETIEEEQADKRLVIPAVAHWPLSLGGMRRGEGESQVRAWSREVQKLPDRSVSRHSRCLRAI